MAELMQGLTNVDAETKEEVDPADWWKTGGE